MEDWAIENWVMLASAIFAAMGAWSWYEAKKRAREDSILRHELAEISVLEARKKELVKASEDLEPAAAELEEQIVEHKRKVLEIQEKTNLEGLSDEEIAKRFADSGL